ncbi:C-type lectin domain-containing protein [Caenorhabditis elegans]|uniref:C-type lectin domain-containing protein n=1 Tax=Caenorhabditis elegans TaxID=6239 RepID=Q9U363_CAEEL|nr:C-type lectin domain-containing protein [Caenorhabditis elegans]CAB63316.3 C-type lectin domain-containing protein [Caenorhabditis elegans]|eukprot:NP_507252.3 C-type LECtin [Caenorhabditis elegans]
MLSGLRKVFRFSRATAVDAPENYSIPSVSAEETEPDETPNERTIVDAYDPPKSEFEPGDRQRHFGILHYTVNNRFKKMMLIGIINVFLILAFFLFMFFFVVQPNVHGGETAVTTLSPTTSSEKVPICTNNFVLIDEKCLQLNTTLYSKPTAEATCNRLGATLLTIQSSEENQKIQSFLSIHQISQIWLGLICNGKSVTSCQWDNGSNVTYYDFAPGFPNVDTGICVSYNITHNSIGQWESLVCYKQLPFVCELPTTTSDNCTNNYKNHCYIQVDQSATIPDAQRICQAQCSNLPSVHSVTENLYLTSIYKFSDTSIILGGIASTPKSIWWFDGSPVNFLNFKTSQRTVASSCIVLHVGDGGDWDTVDCSTTVSTFLCKRATGVSCK